MLLKRIFGKFKFKETKWIEASLYGFIYSILALIIFVSAAFTLKKYYWKRDLLISLFIGIMMFVLYVIKLEVFKFRVKGQ